LLDEAPDSRLGCAFIAKHEETIMRNLLALGAAALIGFAGIGWYLGWYKIETTPTATGRHISIDLNTPQIKKDISHGKEKLRDILADDKSNSNAPPQSGVTPTGYQQPDYGNNPPFTPVPPSGTAPTLPPPR
jgi:hypothetical protein